jgi:hypothetical protein
MMKRFSLFLILGITGCVDAQTQCANRLGIPQDDSYIYLSRVSDNMRIAYSQCISDIEAERLARALAVSRALQQAGQSMQQPQVQHCYTQCIGISCFTRCQ